MKWLVAVILMVIMSVSAWGQARDANKFLIKQFEIQTCVPAHDLVRWLGVDFKYEPIKYGPANSGGYRGVDDCAWITLTKSGKTLKMGVGYLAAPEAMVDGVAQKYAIGEEIVDGKLYLAAARIAKIFGMELQYDPAKLEIAVWQDGKKVRVERWSTAHQAGIKSPTYIRTKKGSSAKGWKAYSPDGFLVARDYRDDYPEQARGFGIFEQKSGWLITTFGFNDSMKLFAWHPDSQRYVTMRDEDSGGEDIMLLPIDPRGEGGAYGTKGRYDRLSFSKDGKFIICGKEKLDIVKDSAWRQLGK